MKLTIVNSDKTIGIGTTFISGITTDLSWIPSNVHAVQWDDTSGIVEYNDGTSNQTINSLGIYSQAETSFNNELKIIQDEQDAAEAAFDYDAALRKVRNKRLLDCDWTRLDDNGLSGSKKTEWATYKQALRNLPANKTGTSKQLYQNNSHSDWPTEPS